MKAFLVLYVYAAAIFFVFTMLAIWMNADSFIAVAERDTNLRWIVRGHPFGSAIKVVGMGVLSAAAWPWSLYQVLKP